MHLFEKRVAFQTRFVFEIGLNKSQKKKALFEISNQKQRHSQVCHEPQRQKHELNLILKK